MLTSVAFASQTQQASSPDLLIVSYSLKDGSSVVSLTYPAVVPHKQAMRDVLSLEQATNETFRDIKVTDDFAPIRGSKHHPLTRMTSVEFISLQSLSNSDHAFAVASLIDAFKSYPKLAFTYFEAPSFHFRGLRNYEDEYVTVRFIRRGNTFTYNVAVRNAHFKRINLPAYSPDPSTIRVSVTKPQSSLASGLKWSLMGLGAIVTCLLIYRITLKYF